jgi:hypothetical protein
MLTRAALILAVVANAGVQAADPPASAPVTLPAILSFPPIRKSDRVAVRRGPVSWRISSRASTRQASASVASPSYHVLISGAAGPDCPMNVSRNRIPVFADAIMRFNTVKPIDSLTVGLRYRATENCEVNCIVVIDPPTLPMRISGVPVAYVEHRETLIRSPSPVTKDLTFKFRKAPPPESPKDASQGTVEIYNPWIKAVEPSSNFDVGFAFSLPSKASVEILEISLQ